MVWYGEGGDRPVSSKLHVWHPANWCVYNTYLVGIKEACCCYRSVKKNVKFKNHGLISITFPWYVRKPDGAR